VDGLLYVDGTQCRECGRREAATTTPTGFVVPATGEAIEFDRTDPGDLETWFGNFGHAEHFRKVILASCREAVRADYTLRQEKISEARLDDLARTHDRYIDWLVYTLHGRRLREQNVLASMGR
jgi:hypothetical protein